MNTDEHRWYLLDTRAGWRASAMLSDAVRWDRGPVTLQPIPGVPQPITDSSGTFGGVADPIGVAVSGGGDVLVLDRSGRRILRFDRCACRFDDLRCTSLLSGATDIAVTAGGDIVVVDAASRRVLVLTAAGQAVRRVIGPLLAGPTGLAPACPSVEVTASAAAAVTTWPAGTWEPWGVATGVGRLIVTDRANGLVHAFDSRGAPCWSSDAAAGDLTPLVRPTALAITRDGHIVVLHEGGSRLRLLDADGHAVGDITARPDEREFCPVMVSLTGDGALCVADADGRCCVVDPASGTTAPGPTLTGVRGLAFDRDGRLVVATPHCLVDMIAAGGYPRAGRFVTVALDAGAAETEWDRVELRGCVPVGASVAITTLTSDAPFSEAEVALLETSRWRGGAVFGDPALTTWDVLITSPPGRYLWLAMELSGDGAVTPCIDDVEVHFPRRTSLRLLPAVFRSGGDRGSFLDRFLEITDTVRSSVVAHIDGAASLFDPLATPARTDADMLAWLATWVGMADTEGLPEERRRRLVAAAAALYRERGKPAGLRRHVAMWLDREVRVLEHYRLRRWAIAGHGRLGDATRLFGADVVRRLQLDEHGEIGSFRLIDTGDPVRDPFHVYAHGFTVAVVARHGDDAEDLADRAMRIVEVVKPAHCVAEIAVVEPRLRVGTQATVGIDGVVAAPPPPVPLGEGRLRAGLSLARDPNLGTGSIVGRRGVIGVTAAVV